MVWSWIPQNWTLIWQYTLDNALLGLAAAAHRAGIIAVPVGIACVRVALAVPAGAVADQRDLRDCRRWRCSWCSIDYTGLGNLTVIIPLTLFSLCILIPNVVDGLRGVAESVRQAATAMGFAQLRRLVQVELPLAIPVSASPGCASRSSRASAWPASAS